MTEYEQRATKMIMSTIEGVKAQIRKAYDKGYKDGKADTPFTDTEEAEDKAYNRGLNDAWEVAGKLFKVPTDALMELFEMKSPYLDFSAQEVLKKLTEYENKNKQKQDAEIKVGDEVITKYKDHAVAVRDTYYLGADKEPFTLIWFGTHMSSCPVNELTKTGRTFPEIAEVLKEMRGAENDE